MGEYLVEIVQYSPTVLQRPAAPTHAAAGPSAQQRLSPRTPNDNPLLAITAGARVSRYSPQTCAQYHDMTHVVDTTRARRIRTTTRPRTWPRPRRLSAPCPHPPPRVHLPALSQRRVGTHLRNPAYARRLYPRPPFRTVASFTVLRILERRAPTCTTANSASTSRRRSTSLIHRSATRPLDRCIDDFFIAPSILYLLRRYS
ncbi:hypothetical protein B0H14DRAFT_3481800 [Mycena olivaceomarginata]|nr:hypothetical protein B0H14DRAFT_3481800 [Mycena olivaceomarginata]